MLDVIYTVLVLVSFIWKTEEALLCQVGSRNVCAYEHAVTPAKVECLLLLLKC